MRRSCPQTDLTRGQTDLKLGFRFTCWRDFLTNRDSLMLTLGAGLFHLILSDFLGLILRFS